MIAFWIAAALISAAAAGLVLHRAALAVAVARQSNEDPALAVYRRQLGEVDELAERGLIAPGDVRSAHTEAARRLLSAADSYAAGFAASSDGRRLAVAVAALAPLAALGIYLAVGSPQSPDQPYKQRVAAWRQADPASLDAAQLAAVMQGVVGERPNDPQALTYLARAQGAAGDSFSAERNVQKALRLTPRDAGLWTLYGEMIMGDQPGTDLPVDAKKAFQNALAIDPRAPNPRYFLARGRIASGDLAGGLADWRALEADLPTADPRRASLAAEIATVEQTHALPAPPPQQPAEPSGGPQAFIRSMVQGLAARLAANPDDPSGWARLVRSYSVLGDSQARDAALAKARGLFKNRPQDLQPIEAAASPAPMAAAPVAAAP